MAPTNPSPLHLCRDETGPELLHGHGITAAVVSLRARPKLHAGRARVDIFGRFGATCMGAVHAPAGHGQHSRLRFRTFTLPEYNT